jgi:hypothetical protein
LRIYWKRFLCLILIFVSLRRRRYTILALQKWLSRTMVLRRHRFVGRFTIEHQAQRHHDGGTSWRWWVDSLLTICEHNGSITIPKASWSRGTARQVVGCFSGQCSLLEEVPVINWTSVIDHNLVVGIRYNTLQLFTRWQRRTLRIIN